MLYRFIWVLSLTSLVATGIVSPAVADPIDPEAVHKMANTVPHRDFHYSIEVEDLRDDAAGAALEPDRAKATPDPLEAARILGEGPCPVAVMLNLGYDNPGGLGDTFEWLNAEAEPQCPDITELSLTVTISDGGLPAVGNSVESVPGSDKWKPPLDVGRTLSADTVQTVPIGSLEGRAHGRGSNLLWFVAVTAVVRGQEVAVCWGVSARQGATDITVMKGC